MIDSKKFLKDLIEKGYTFFTGVPCSFLTPLINEAASQKEGSSYIPATSEGEAIAIAAGAWIAGKKTVVMAQNSGLGNMINPLTSLNYPFKIPSMLIITWRGQPGIQDEPQHVLMGGITQEVLKSIKVRSTILTSDYDQIKKAVIAAAKFLSQNKLPYAFLVPSDIFAPSLLTEPLPVQKPLGEVITSFINSNIAPKRISVLKCILEQVPQDVGIIATTGKCGRELYTLGDGPQHFYMVGAMGSASAFALGVALHTKRKVIIIDGDGAALMRLGTFATIGAFGTKNLIHILLDNGVHDSTGGQQTLSHSISFNKVAHACNYRFSYSCNNLNDFNCYLGKAMLQDGPILLHIRIVPGSTNNLGRPKISPEDAACRFSEFLKDSSISKNIHS